MKDLSTINNRMRTILFFVFRSRFFAGMICILIGICFFRNGYAQQRKYSTFYEQRSTLFELLPISSGDIVFLGNSITNGGEWSELFNSPQVKNRGISGDITAGVYERLDPILAGKPAKIFLMIGVNDIALDIPFDTIVDNIRKIMEKTSKESPETRMYLQSILPVNDRFGMFEKHVSKGNVIKAVNDHLKQLAEEYGITYVDLYSHFKNPEDDKLNPLYTNDGLHLKGAGYILWRDVVSGYVNEHSGLRLSPVYSDNMVLQRNRPLLISGMADAGEAVSVGIGKQRKNTVTASDGRWQVVLDPLQSGEIYTLTIETTTRKFSYSNVAAGEVWLCSGQSNMAFPLKNAETGLADIPDISSRNIRLFSMIPRWDTSDIEWRNSCLDSVNRLEYFKFPGWVECDTHTVPDFSAVACYFGKMLYDSLQVPIGLICNAVGGSPCESWVSREMLESGFPDILDDWKSNDIIQPWVRERALKNIAKTGMPDQRHPYEPAYLYESGIDCLDRFPVRGIIWYQGESNAHDIAAYERLFPLLVKCWRDYWQQEDLPFYYVQLSGIDRPLWPCFRDLQRRMLPLISHSGMAVSSDKGDSLNVHPVWKKEIGLRLARWALHSTYGKTLIPSGPLFRAAEFSGGSGYVSFDYADGLRTSDGMPLRTFEIAGTEGSYIPANAEIVGHRIRVWSDKLAKPRFIRYGWQPFTRANLINADSLPASTFKSGK